MMIQKILIGTTNEGKQKEFIRIIHKLDPIIKILLPQDLNITEKPDETGKTFEENSLIKAKFYYDMTGIPTIADDGGPEIAILHNEPGVKSRRWTGYEASDEELINYTLKKLENYPNKSDRTAQLRTCITYYDGKNIIQEIGQINGYISRERFKTVPYSNGYPFRSLFIVSGLNKYYGELTQEEHDQYNHRQQVLTKLWKKIIPI